METQVLKMWKKQVEEVVKKLGEKYEFNAEEALAYLNPEVEEKNRGRPEKKTKKVVNKAAMVEDIINTIMTTGEETETATGVSATGVSATEVVAPVVEKKKRAPAKKVVAAAAPVVTEVVTEVAPEVAVETTAIAVPVVAKKKVTKKKVPEVAPEAVAVVVPEVAPEAVAEVTAVVVPVAVAPVVVAPVVVEKKKVTKKKTAPATEFVASPVEVATVEAVVVAPVVEKKKVTKKKSPEPAAIVSAELKENKEHKDDVEKTKKRDALKASEKKVAPAVVVEKAPEPEELVEEELVEEDSGDGVKEWEYKGKTYYKGCVHSCDVDHCDCPGAVYDVDTQDPAGNWNGKELLPLAEEED
jgi:hypothetical protein